MAARIVHRGPDDDDLYHDNQVALGLRRLSIIDLAGGRQPLFNEDRSLVLVCNGEIYNFRELRDELRGRGHSFRTGSDAEVLLHLYEEFGDEFISRAEGMFGFALWDTRRERLILGRDRLGIKPVYFSQTAGTLIFSSEVKALLAHPAQTASLDPSALEGFLSLGYLNNGHSLFSDIELLGAGEMLICENGRIERQRYWQLELNPDHGNSDAQWVEEIRSTLASSIQAQMVSDVPVAAFLSGGIDSSLIVAYMSQFIDSPLKTYSIGYQGSSGAALYNELPYARQIAELHGTEHHEIVVQPDVVGLLPSLVWHMDAPISDSALITSNLVSEFASRDVKVILSGVGGDELFGGYDRYLMSYYVGLLERLPDWLRKNLLTPVARQLPVDRHSKILNILRYFRTVTLLADAPGSERYHQLMQIFSPNQLASLLKQGPSGEPDALQLVLGKNADLSQLDSMFMADIQTQMTDDLLLLTDKMSMAHSLECRVPLLDERLVELATRMPDQQRVKGRNTRFAIRKALRGVLPDEILDRKKRGFGAPVGSWLKQELEPLIAYLLSPQQIDKRGLFRPESVAQVISDHRENKADHSDHLFALITLEIWQRLFIDGEQTESLSAELSTAVAGPV